jgi:hypothetical protein
MFFDQHGYSEALAGAHHLQALDLKLPFLPSLNKMLRMFGSLDHLTRLHTISVTVSQQTDQADWQELDRLLGVLSDLPALAEVNIFSGSEWDKPHPESLLRAWMPTLAGRDVLRVHNVVPDFSIKT